MIYSFFCKLMIVNLIKVDQNFSLILLCHIIYFFFEHVPTIFFLADVKKSQQNMSIFSKCESTFNDFDQMLAMLVSIYRYMYFFFRSTRLWTCLTWEKDTTPYRRGWAGWSAQSWSLVYRQTFCSPSGNRGLWLSSYRNQVKDRDFCEYHNCAMD